MPEATLNIEAWLWALAAILLAAVAAWVLSVIRRDVSIVDSLWSLLFALGLGVYLAVSDVSGPRVWLVTAMVTAWALRLSIYITVRNHGQPEDRRYQAIRRNNEPHFWLKSLYIVFLLQGLLAWVVCLPALAAVSGRTPPGSLLAWVEGLGVALWLAGMFFEVVGDWQLARFRRSRPAQGAVLDSGLWRYTRHPNYFGEALLWWGIYLVALSAGAWWAVVSPLLLTFLLLRVSGVALLEKDISERRPAYREYVRRTNAFFPGLPRPVPQAADGV
jgi:steroid 5-alpha reductase family enzyme